MSEYESLLNLNTDCEYVTRAAPLVFAHLVRQTCELAKEDDNSHKEGIRCFRDIGNKWAKKFWGKYQSASDRNMRDVYMGALSNLRFGGQAKILQPLIEGKTGASDEDRVYALWAAWADNMVHGKLMDVYFPLFANPANHHEVRIHALMALLYKTPSTTDMARVIGVLRVEKDYEVVNFAKAHIEKMAHSIDPCHKDSAKVAGFFLKYLKQLDKYDVDWGFGVSKTYTRQFVKKEYGSAGNVNFITVGSHDSTTPISIGMSISTTLHNNYKANSMFISFRIEGLAKALVRKFKTMDPTTWKLDDLSKILKTEMNIRERPDQPVRAGYFVMLKDTIAFQGSFDDQDAGQGDNKIQYTNSNMERV